VSVGLFNTAARRCTLR